MTVIALADISKSYGAIRALAGVTLTLRSGEIHALLGENGAGKSTLLGILSGLVPADSGTITADGASIALRSATEAFQAGIATVFQHFTLVPNLTVAENLKLAASATRSLSRTGLQHELRALGLELPLDERVEALGVGQRQQVEIAKALLHKPRVLLLDEPTSVLAGEEIHALLALIRGIAEQEVAVVFVTHKLDEALTVADRITVLRRGIVTGQIDRTAPLPAETADLSRRLLVMLFGERAPMSRSANKPTAARDNSRTIAKLREITTQPEHGEPGLQGLSLDLVGGEILAIAGIEGNGQYHLERVISGEQRVSSGTMQIGDRDHTNVGVPAMIAVGVVATTAERIDVGCVSGMSLATNLVLKHLTSPPFSEGTRLDRGEIRWFARGLIAQYDIRAGDPDQPIEQLSGGNIQRALLARELAFSPQVLVCNQPTAGLDLATAEAMHQRLRLAADEGAAIVLISSDLDELLNHADRIAVMFRGQIVGILPRFAFDQETIAGLMVTGREGSA